MRRSLIPSFLLLVLASCGGPRHYELHEITSMPLEDRKVLFGRGNATTMVLDEVIRKYRCKPIKWTGRVRNVIDSGRLQLITEILDAKQHFVCGCRAYFGGHAREDLAKLREGDTVTVVGELRGQSLGTIEFTNCELVRARRKRKLISPPPGAKKKP